MDNIIDFLEYVTRIKKNNQYEQSGRKVTRKTQGEKSLGKDTTTSYILPVDGADSWGVGGGLHMTGLAAESALTFGASNTVTDERLKELVLYVCDKCINDPDFGATKLNKILLYSDFEGFRQLGEPVTGAEYMRQDRGPVPRHFKPVTVDMQAKGELAVRRIPHYGDARRTQHRYIALRPANLGLFRADQIAIIDAVIGALDGLNAKAVSDMTHGYVWRAVPNGGGIPYEAAFISDEPLNEGDVEWARRANEKYKWETVEV